MKNVQQFSTLLKPLAASLALAGLVAVSLAGCDSANSKVPDAPAAGGPPVSTAAVVEKQITETQEFSGRLEAIDRVEIRSRVNGFITSVNFKPGSEVKKGEVLFVIDPRPYQAEVERTEGAAASARAKAGLAKLELTRSEKLLAEKAIAQREYDEKAADMKGLEADARAAQASYDAAKLNLSYTRVESPISGRVSKAEITVGNLIDASAILTSVVSTDRIYASFDGDEDTYLRVAGTAQKGTPVTVKIGLANETGFPHEGKLEFVDNRLDPATGSVRMRATFANTDRELVPGLFARVQLDGGNGPKAQSTALLISDRAVGTDQSRKFVYVIGADNKAEYRAVKLGPNSDGLRVVREGLKAGEKIVVNGLQRVRPGAAVTPQLVAMDFDPTAPAAPAKPAAKDAKIAAKAASTTKE
ncbi:MULTISPECIES: efflux RND transporter periplasmic adaptor subunit [unclassified Janthinobacterium]|uniref:efflux RND transporter periplasmic adaptor subunit n=1 Tax=unclassified Janthinobacterium TaxID=2610881 RepID=UPI00161DD11E|nr:MULTISPECIES: efflux RND transporter periplasmic adaptor subunit [unclassified Janthinobacterium]MBB5368828.1 multidrug efflux system membrane fusion protein [Janthinobacterium sp. K2C7]MBB5381636.1 multidrug efflux system membrane fusion protein [Janthinobacterium sp. K2Li3]MBB5387210.1 multidrug efflux system membrane fusion protein [Janthinobacterium sp. K2E3]